MKISQFFFRKKNVRFRFDFFFSPPPPPHLIHRFQAKLLDRQSKAKPHMCEMERFMDFQSMVFFSPLFDRNLNFSCSREDKVVKIEFWFSSAFFQLQETLRQVMRSFKQLMKVKTVETLLKDYSSSSMNHQLTNDLFLRAFSSSHSH